MPIHPQFIVRDMKGRPLPSPELVAKLKKYDPRVGLFYTKAAWAITEAWPENDPRRQYIQNGSMQPEYAFDICGYLPVTCAVDEAPAYIERELQSWSTEKFQGLRQAMNHWNDVEQPKMLEEAVLSHVSNDLDKSNIVTPGIYEPVLKDFELPSEPDAEPPFDLSLAGVQATPEFTSKTPDQLSSIAKAREVLAQKRLERKGQG
jgi:hypothetical protein